MNIAPSAGEWAARICASWRASVNAILEVGSLLAQSKEALGHGEWEAMCEERLPFGAETARRLMAIAADPKLANPTHVRLLPPSWGTLHELTKLTQEQFDDMVADGTINPEMDRRDVVGRVKAEKRATKERDLGAKQAFAPKLRYGVILADPEWRFEPYSRETGMDRAADNHYPTTGIEDLLKERAELVRQLAADDCVYFQWATVPMLPHALRLMEACGFQYRSHVVWAKDRIGTGYWFRNAHELLLVGVKGNIPAPAPGTQRPSLIEGRVTKHSAKPEVFHELIEEYFPTLPKIELNRRGPPRPGWRAWGNEAESCQATTEDNCGQQRTLPPHDPGTGKIIENDACPCASSEPAVPTPSVVPAGSSPDHDILDIPSFLRRDQNDQRPAP